MTTLPTTSSIRLPRSGSPGGQVLAMPATQLGPVGPGAAAQPLLTPADIWRVLRGNWLLILLSVVVASGAGLALYKWQAETNPRYTAAGTLSIGRQLRPDPVRGGVIAVDQGGLDLPIMISSQANDLMQTNLWMQVIEANPKIRELGWFKNFERQVAAKPEPDVTAASLARDDLAGNFRVGRIPETNRLRVAMETANSSDARDIVQFIVDAHIVNQQRDTFDRTNAELETSKQWRERYVREMGRVRDRMNQLQSALGGSGGGASFGRLNIKEMEISSLMNAMMQARLASNEAKSQFDAIDQQVKAGRDPAQVEAMVRADPPVQRLKAMLDDIELQMEIYKDMGPESRFLKDLVVRRDVMRAKLERAEAEARATYRNQLLDSANAAMQSKKAEEENLQAQVDSRRTELSELSAQLSEFYSLKDEFDSFKVLEREMSERVAVLQNALRQETSGVRWAQQPVASNERSSPKLAMYLPTAVLLGLAFSLGIAFLRELMDTSVRSPRDVAKVGAMNLLGMVANETDDPQLAGVPLHVVISQAPHSMMAEQFRQVRTRLQHAASLDTTRTIVITSPGPGDGKTTVACNLAAGLALNGRRILLVDANFRRPDLHRLFSLPNEMGFANVLDSLSNLESAVQKTTIPNLEVLTTGPKAANPTELLESQLFSDFIDRSLEEYDHVIFDTGPLLVVSEAVALAPRVDGVITVVRAKKNSRGMLSRVRDTLKQIKAEHLGVVLNGVQTWGGGYYGRNIKTYYAYQNGN
jgi:polysaccharide biosynthesis transport protein